MVHILIYRDLTSSDHETLHVGNFNDETPHHRDSLRGLLKAEAKGLIDITHWIKLTTSAPHHTAVIVKPQCPSCKARTLSQTNKTRPTPTITITDTPHLAFKGI